MTDKTDPNTNNDYYAIIGAGGDLEIDAPYIGFDSVVQSISTPDYGIPGMNSVTFRADNIDVMGAVLLDTSIAMRRFMRLARASYWRPASLPHAGTTP
jgi:hypothetical protein